MYIIDLKKVVFPKKLVEKKNEAIETSRKGMVEQLVANGVERSEAEKDALVRFPKEKWDSIKEFEDAINSAITNYTFLKYFDKEKKATVAPWDVRKIAGKLSAKVMDAEKGEFEASEEQLDFLLKVFQSDLPTSDDFYYIGEYLETVKLEGTKEDKKK